MEVLWSGTILSNDRNVNITQIFYTKAELSWRPQNDSSSIFSMVCLIMFESTIEKSEFQNILLHTFRVILYLYFSFFRSFILSLDWFDRSLLASSQIFNNESKEEGQWLVTEKVFRVFKREKTLHLKKEEGWGAWVGKITRGTSKTAFEFQNRMSYLFSIHPAKELKNVKNRHY